MKKTYTVNFEVMNFWLDQDEWNQQWQSAVKRITELFDKPWMQTFTLVGLDEDCLSRSIWFEVEIQASDLWFARGDRKSVV